MTRQIVFALLVALASAAAAAQDPFRVLIMAANTNSWMTEALERYGEWLEATYNVDARLLATDSETELPGLALLGETDAVLFYGDSLHLNARDLATLRDYLESGRPFVAIRNAGHAFENWVVFDRDVLGGDHTGQFIVGPTVTTTVRARDAEHPILRDVGAIKSRNALYHFAPLADDCDVLLWGETPASNRPQPIAWTREANDGRLFYTSLGDHSDLLGTSVRRMLAQALYWTAGREPEGKALPPIPGRMPYSRTIAFAIRRPIGLVRPHGNEPVEIRAGQQERTLETGTMAIVVCDMWDVHWCPSASARVDELAPKIERFVSAGRDAGMLIVHAPSDTMDYYDGQIPRRRAQAAPDATPPKELPLEDPPLPIDSSDGGCAEDVPQYAPWTRQHPRIAIHDTDAITDSGDEAFRLFRAHGIEHVIYVGVHVNMCILDRSFGIRQMRRWGFSTYLARDLTDSMYSSDDAPYVSQAEGTALVVEHIERHWGPSFESADLLRALS